MPKQAHTEETEMLLPPLKELAGGVTIAFPQRPSLPPGQNAGVAVVEGTGVHLSSETHSLRQARLRAAAIFLLGSLSLFLIWRLTFATPNLWPLNVVIISGIAAALAFLYNPTPISRGKLKLLECMIFGLMGIYIAIREYYGLVTDVADGATLLATVRGGVVWTILLMFSYAMLIPNTWQSAAKVVIPISIIPTVAKALAYLLHPEIFRTMTEIATREMISENILFVLVALFLSIYGTHVLNELRTEAFVAKQLNQYRLVKLIGSGGMGDVYLAEHRMMKRPCALKLIRPDKASDPRSLARFIQEVQATSKLSHPNTIEIYDYGRTEDNTFYYVMEYLPGLSLEDLVEIHGPMPPARVIFLLRQACGALAEAHASGLIHRDLKPANIFAAQRGGRFDVAKLLDFGLVKNMANDSESGEAITREFTVQGTPLYMAPEQAMGKTDIDHRIDLYAMGGIAYTLLTGRPPFERESRVAVMAAHAHDALVPPSTLRVDVPEDLERVVLRCLAKSSSDRYPDAESLDRALAACAAAPDWDFQHAARWWHEFVLPKTESTHNVQPAAIH